uniref:Uncharacterized protein n=1 Tax=Rhizochromulina marina TaxID=1034831 RepID=A0A7S2RUF0_9STRA
MRWRMRRRRRQRDQDDEEGGSGCVSWNSLSVCLTAAVLGLGALYVLSPAAVGFQEASSPPSQVTTIVFQAGSDLAAEQRRIRRPFDSVHLTWQPHGDSTDTWILQSGMALSHEAQHVHKPKQIISVFGLEESGSDLVSKTIAHALGMAPFGTWAGNGSLRTSRTVLQHLPLPWGGNCDSDSDVVQTLNVFDSLTMEELIVPPRFFVNITTHVRHLKVSIALQETEACFLIFPLSTPHSPAPTFDAFMRWKCLNRLASEKGAAGQGPGGISDAGGHGQPHPQTGASHVQHTRNDSRGFFLSQQGTCNI